jgi:late competence protein required for DNA uptake (superfamily II DNA/RNA helicase)
MGKYYSKQSQIDDLRRVIQSKEEAETKRIEEEKKLKQRWWSATVYCTNCLEVNNVSIPPELKIENGDCVICRVKGCLKLVRKVNGR